MPNSKESNIERSADQTEPNETSQDELIRGLYTSILHREADAGGLEHYGRQADAMHVEEDMLASEELHNLVMSGAYFDRRWSASPRVLLFGAYGNGNLGDALQAITLQRLINDVSPTAEVWACSDMRAPFPFQHERVLAPEFIRSYQIVNQFDLLIIGGGGLWGTLHEPLCEPEWQETLQAPAAIFAVGADRSVVQSSAALIKKACYASARDKESLASLRELREDVALVPDPVFWDMAYERVSGRANGTGKKAPKPRSGRKLWILSRKVFGPEKQVFRELYNRDRDKVCFFQPAIDYPIGAEIPEARPIYGPHELFDLIDNVDVVVSARYHGCILAMLRNKPVVGIGENKIKSLFHRFGARGAFYDTFSELAHFDWQTALPGAAFLEENRTLIRRGMADAMQHVRSRQAGQ